MGKARGWARGRTEQAEGRGLRELALEEDRADACINGYPMNRAFFRLMLGVVLTGSLFAAGYDTARSIIEAADIMPVANTTGQGEANRPWLRIRGLYRVQSDPAARATERAAMVALRAKGYRLVCLLRWNPPDWSAVRPGKGPGARSPLDLREAFARGRALAEVYGDLVDVWEFDNEPDIAFFADNADVFAAYHKAVALGLGAGGAGTGFNVEGGKGGNGTDGMWKAGKAGSDVGTSGRSEGAEGEGSEELGARSEEQGAGSGERGARKALILMAAPGLPPGPHFEQLGRNGYFSYTEGFNFHYYGFARDFTGVYEQFRDAVGATGAGGGVIPRGATTETRRWPVFITEWGYSLLDGVEARTTEGRVRQWRFFQDVARQNERLGVAAPMAFLLPPYFEHNMKEFGLTMLPAPGAGGAGAVADGEFQAAGVTFRPEDFGAKALEPWMKGIGETWGKDGWAASPALAWLEANGRAAGKRRSRDWVVRTEKASPVVIDFIAGWATQVVKVCDGYFLCDMDYLDGPKLPRRLGRGTVVLYNFGTEAADVKLPWPAELLPMDAEGLVTGSWRLEPGERREVPVMASVDGDGYRPTEVALAAEVQVGGVSTLSRWASRFYPNPAGMLEAARRDFRFPPEAGAANRSRLERRPLAPEEPALRRDGRWLVTEGVAVEEIDGGWRFHITRFPGVGLRPAVAELPLPAGWHFELDEVFLFNYRLLDGPGAVELRWDHPDATRRRQTGNFGMIAEPYFRTTDGKLFSAGSRLSPTVRWGRFQHGAEAFGMRFLGRTTPPWRSEENQTAALVFFLRPSRLPAVLEVQDPHLARWTVGGR